MSSSLAFSFFFFFLLSLSSSSEAAGSVGINYGRIANDLPTPSKVVELLKTQGINRVKLYDTEATVLTALKNSGIKVIVAMPNELLSAAAADQSYTDTWIQTNIISYYPATQIEAIAVGNEVFVDPNNTTNYLVPAMKNVHASLVKNNLDKTIKISSPIALSALQSSYPTSSGSFKTELIEPVIKPMLKFLQQTESYLMVNAYPFFAYAANSDTISLDYALFKQNPGVVDSGNGLKYDNLFDAQVDAVNAAMSALQYNDIKITVSETGWPSLGDSNEIGAGEDNAASYNGNLVKRVLSGNGTPLKPKDPLNVNTSSSAVAPVAAGTGRSQVPVSGGDVSSAGNSGKTWCVANGGYSEEKLQHALDYACGEGGADCTPIQPGATCYNPNTLEAHASYAFNSYYQKMSRGTGTCDFGGAAYVVTQPP
ncbi:glucan endo-1,3-beta-glucosidase 12-like protein, partial [Trifolium pratense]